MKKVLVALFIFSFLACPVLLSAAAGPDIQPWLNVSVQAAENNANINVHLPLGLILSVMEHIRVDGFDAGKIKLDTGDADIDWPALLEAVKGGAAGKYVTVQSDEADVNISKTAKHLLIKVHQKEDEKAEVSVKLPLELLDSVSIGENNEIDLAALLRGLKKLPAGDLVTVNSEEARVRVWVE